MSRPTPSEAVAPVPKVSVTITTYNHEAWIEQSVESVLAQVTDFDVEILIGEDCSTDRTRGIVLELQRKHPDRIRLFLPERNMGRRGTAIYAEVWKLARGEYIAGLDGDDYWSSPRKLALQVEFLERNPACSMCFHDVGVLLPDGSRAATNYTAPDQKPFSTLDDLWDANAIASCSPMIRRSILPELPAWYSDLVFGDWSLNLLAARHGQVGYLAQELAIYRSHGGGLWSGASRAEQIEHTIGFLEGIDRCFGYAHTRSIRPRVSRLGYELAVAYREADDRRAARRAALRAWWTCPLNALVPPRRVFEVFRRVFVDER